MIANRNFYNNNLISSLQQSITSILDNPDKRIFTLVTIALAILGACYLAYRCVRYFLSEVRIFKVVKGETFEGVFDDQLNGTGKKLGRIYSSEGDFKEGNLIKGKRTILAHGIIDEGHFNNGKLNGNGSRVTKDVVFKGEFKNDELNGEGKILFTSGLHQEGTFKDGQLNGKGKEYYNADHFLEGEFENGKLNGPGKVNKYGKVEEGIFKNGVLVSATVNPPPVATTSTP